MQSYVNFSSKRAHELCRQYGDNSYQPLPTRLAEYAKDLIAFQEVPLIHSIQSRALLFLKENVYTIGGLHSGDDEEWRVLGYRIPVRTTPLKAQSVSTM
jgi:hypothetical protein